MAKARPDLIVASGAPLLFQTQGPNGWDTGHPLVSGVLVATESPIAVAAAPAATTPTTVQSHHFLYIGVGGIVETGDSLWGRGSQNRLLPLLFALDFE